jgi:EAL domain-containing protein (putative c-di-GMP-specific phosphodiesterase class I)
MQRLGMTIEIDRVVVRTTVSILEAREQRGLDPMLMCGVNLAGTSLCCPDFQMFLETQLSRLSYPDQICFEVTETELIPNLQSAARFMTRIKNSGCRFALDDFGNGLCSFAYLKSLPIDVIKIDGQFVRDCPASRVDRKIVESIHRLCTSLGVETVAECVESEAIYKMVRDIGINSCQGYFFGYPAPCRELNI